MIDPTIKLIIEKENKSIEEKQYIKYLKDDNLNKKSFLNIKSDTCKYMLKNFRKMFKSFSEYIDFLDYICMEEQYEIIKKIPVESLTDFINAELPNQKSIGLSNVIKSLKVTDSLEPFFKGKFKQFYESLDKEWIDFTKIFNDHLGAPELMDILKDEYMPLFEEKLKDRSLHYTAVNFFTKELCRDIEQSRKCGMDVSEKLRKLEMYAPVLMETTNKPIELKKILKSEPINFDETDKIFNSHIDRVIREMEGYSFLTEKEELKIDEKILGIVLKEVSENENLQISDIEFLAKGGYSTVFSIGDKVIKIGRDPHTYSIPKNHRRLNQPLMRYRDPVNPSLYIEIAEKCDIGLNVTNEDLYELYKELRNDGLVWTDIKDVNVGRLRKTNGIHFNGISKVATNFLGFREENEIEELQPGELVITDLDYIFADNDPNIAYPVGSIALAFEKRYKNEKEGKEGCKVKDKDDIEI